ncbi:hypothetical protein AB0J43_22470 [Nonomuraea fuscirosea]
MIYPPLPETPTWADLVPGDHIDLARTITPDVRFTWTIHAPIEPVLDVAGLVVVPFHSSAEPGRLMTMRTRSSQLVVTDFPEYDVAVRPSHDRRSA